MTVKKCIWCKNEESPNTPFISRPHTVPNSLGGKHFCFDVCDKCNFAFGKLYADGLGIEASLKEVFNVSKIILTKNEYDKIILIEDKKLNLNDRKLMLDLNKINKKLKYFQIDLINNKITLNQKSILFRDPDAQFLIGRYFRRGLYKMFLEERQRIKGDSLNPKFDYIREFALNDKNNMNVYYLIPKMPAIFVNQNLVLYPEFYFDEKSEYMIDNFRVYSFNFIGHQFLLTINNIFEDLKIKNNYKFIKYFIENYSIYSNLSKKIDSIYDFDFTFTFMKDK